MSSQKEIAYLRSAKAIRDRCGILFDLAREDRLEHFRCDLTQLRPVADYVIEVMRENYPDLQIPFHSRWRHFAAARSRLTQLERKLAELTPLAKAQAKFDLAIVSVLLDAGAGATWQYCDPDTNLVFHRSEGLAIASFHMFCQGTFSSHADKLQADALGLQNLTEDVLAAGLQVSPDNPLVGLPGRLHLLRRLGQTIVSHPQLFGRDRPRPGGLVNYLLAKVTRGQLAAEKVFSAVLEGLGNIWTGRLQIDGVNLGDVWYHSALNNSTENGLVPFHKLSQWLTYSLLEPLQELGLEITGLDALTGLPEYRNGGLCLDLGLLQPKYPNLLQQAHRVDSEVIVEWRALTVILLDYIAATIREKLAMDAQELPLVKVLQGGTWSAGRKIAAQLRRHGVPPLQIESDGTVF
ncbi:URC4/urg3 family protein [Chroococcidiopsis sp. TS-821]|uniref:URC4/urg3 family protein n=1 Tax=Chroococcidiopsis sp. TS-821 TaxID=1378066 RepID=UPI000CEF37DA|nr:URC4/urg3 family protein [Chroococcidiopsis sp. TS-821]PPS44372.1 uracil phosphoribosyltransferase [Chroococcidiopsis sp. TS-821]